MKQFPVAVGILISLPAVACSNKPQKASPSAAAVTTVVEGLAQATPPQPPAPADTDLTQYLKDLRCTKTSTNEACRILSEFSEAKRWTFNAPSGQARWLGNEYLREKGIEKKRLSVLWAKRMPTAQVGPGELPLRVGTGSIDESLWEHGFKMVKAISSGDQPSKRNQARPVIDAFEPTHQRGAVATEGQSIRLVAEETVLLRQSGRKVLLFSPNLAPSATAGDGIYAEFWLSNW